ncbi:MAG: hypothetical protein WKF74_02975 [Pyrinomonadaceae bacterium]
MNTPDTNLGTSSAKGQSVQASPNPESPDVLPNKEEWILRSETREAHYSIERLISFASRGHLKPEWYVYHPLLEKWLYAKDVGELQVYFRRNSASQFNKLSWLLFGVSLLLSFAGAWLIASILFIAAIVLAILYHVKR